MHLNLREFIYSTIKTVLLFFVPHTKEKNMNSIMKNLQPRIKFNDKFTLATLKFSKWVKLILGRPPPIFLRTSLGVPSDFPLGSLWESVSVLSSFFG
jgi:hypothetical protein